ncbi:hypothetical protein [Natronorubrum sp. A-ect3]|uniref:hypothetical protein n=1 Tax=Natronorubrum sp. A-ect3 TaxID=3242698 RepID=UPI00359E8F3C
MTVSRRKLLGLAGTAAVATAGIAGCLTVDAQDANDSDLPAYSRWLTIDDGGLEFAHVDWATLQEYVEGELEDEDFDADVPAEFEADPMIAPVSEGLIQAYFFVGTSLAPYRLGQLLDDDAELESTAEDLLLTTAAFIVTGAMVPDEIDEQITAEPELDFFRQMEQTDEIGGYDIYTPVAVEDNAAIAVDSDTLVFVGGEEIQAGGDPLTVLETLIGASEGDIELATDESEALEWLVETAGHGDVTVGQYGARVGASADSTEDEELIDLTFEGLDDADGIVSSLTVEDEETSTGDFAAIIDDPDEDALEALLGASADEQSIDVDENRVTATGTWRELE